MASSIMKNIIDALVARAIWNLLGVPTWQTTPIQEQI
jgi:hypothetical protein